MAPIIATTPIPKTTQITLREPSLPVKLLTAGTSACIADLFTFPLDTAKVRLQIQGEVTSAAAKPVRHFITTAAAAASTPGFGSGSVLLESSSSSLRHIRYNGMIGTILTIAREEGPKSLYNGLVAGLQRQMCFASIRIGLYESIKTAYQSALDGGRKNNSASVYVRVFAGITTGGLAVLFAQPTDVVKVRMQAQMRTVGRPRYLGTIHAYKTIAMEEGLAGLWKGTLPNVSRNAIVNVAEIVCYDIFKEFILSHQWMKDGVPCHFTSAVAAGFCTTVVASPVDVVKTRFMNSPSGQYRGALDCAARMLLQEGPAAFYKGFMPSFSRLVSWNICMWITYEQLKLLVLHAYNQPTLHKL